MPLSQKQIILSILQSVHHIYFCITYRAWPTLHVESLSNKNVKELIHAELATMDAQIGSEDSLILTHCRTPATCSPLYVMVLARHISGYKLLLWRFTKILRLATIVFQSVKLSRNTDKYFLAHLSRKALIQFLMSLC